MNVIDNYCLYYVPQNSPGSVNDVLMIYFGENRLIDGRELSGKVITMTAKKEVIGFALLEFSHLVKIKIDGTIFLPNAYLIKIINDYLSSLGLDYSLEEKSISGYVVGKLLEVEEKHKAYIYKVDIKDEIIHVESSYELPLNHLVCIAKVNTYLLPGRMIQEYKTKEDIIIKGRICTYDDLQMQVTDSYKPLLMMEDELEVGQDFFMMEEKSHD